MNKLVITITLLLIGSAASCSEMLLFGDSFDGSTTGKSSGVTFVEGKDGQAVLLDSPTDSVEFPATCFDPLAGRIEFDVQLTRPINTQHKSYGLLSDTGAGSAGNGALDLLWWENTNRLDYGIYERPWPQWNWCRSKDLDFQPGRWYHIAISYGQPGMRLDVDGKTVESNSYTGGLMTSAKKFGYHDGYVESPPVMIDNFRTYSCAYDYLRLSNHLLSPNGDGLFDSTVITYGVADKAKVSVDVIDAGGKVVGHILQGHEAQPGPNDANWTGEGLGDGYYTVELAIAGDSGARKLNAKVRIDNRWKRSNTAWTQGEYFPTGVWYYYDALSPAKRAANNEPKEVAAYYDRTLRDLSEHGVNMIVFCWVPKTYRKLLLDTAWKYNIKGLVALDDVTTMITNGKPEDQMNLFDLAENTIKGIKDHPAVGGWYICDEPQSNDELVKRIADAKNALELIDPKHPSFSCLLGGYEDILKAVDYRVLLVDIYLLWEKWDGDMSGYIGELDRAHRNAGDRPLWIIPQIFGKPGTWKIPTPEECRAQVWLALAHGAKGFIYFIYQSTPDGEFLQGMVDMDLKPMDGRFAEIAQLNADIKKLSRVLLGLKAADYPIPAKSDSVLARAFVDGSGARYAILASKDTKRRSVVRWEGEPATDMLTGASAGRLITLEPGAGRLLKLR